MAAVLEPDSECTFHCCLPGPHQHQQFIQIYLTAPKSATKTLSSFCTVGVPRALPLILSDKLWNIPQKDVFVDIGPDARPCIQLSSFLHLVIVWVRSLRTRTRRTKRRRCWCTSLLGGGCCQGWSRSSQSFLMPHRQKLRHKTALWHPFGGSFLKFGRIGPIVLEHISSELCNYQC